MEFGISDKDLSQIRGVLKKYPEIEKVLIYGSRAKGNYRPESDIDLTLIGSDLNLSVQQSAEIELEDLPVPYKFDISIYYHISNLNLIDHIKRVGKLFYEKMS